MPSFIKETYSSTNNDWWNLTTIHHYHCYFYDELYNDSLFEQWKIQNPSSMKNSVIKRKAEFLAGRYCAKHLLENLGIHNFNIEIGDLRSPIWPRGVIGSISHCHQIATAVATTHPKIFGLGVDIETIVNTDTMDQIFETIITDEEKNLFNTTFKTRNRDFTIIFSLKESFFKAAFPLVQQYFDFDCITVLNVNIESNCCAFRLNKRLHSRLLAGMVFTGQIKQVDEDKIATLVALPDRQIQ